jgi:transcriptional regulator with XRE-family HTH domain
MLQTGGDGLLLLNVLCRCLTNDGVVLYNVRVSTQEAPIVTFLKEVMRRRKRLPSQLAADLGVSHATVSRWLSAKDVPNIRSCQRLVAYSGVPLEKVLSLVGYLPAIAERAPAEWPEFREYAHQMYPNELDEDLITMIEDLIERRRRRKYGDENPKMGS